MSGRAAAGTEYDASLSYRLLSDASQRIFSLADAEKAGNSFCDPLTGFTDRKGMFSCDLENQPKFSYQKEARMLGKVERDPFSRSAVKQGTNQSEWSPVPGDNESRLNDSVFGPLQNVSRFKALEFMKMSLGNRKLSQGAKEDLLQKLAPEWSSSGFATGNRFALLAPRD